MSDKESNQDIGTLEGSADYLARTIYEQKRLQKELSNLALQIKNSHPSTLINCDLKSTLKLISDTLSKSQAQQIESINRLRDNINKLPSTSQSLGKSSADLYNPFRRDFGRLTQNNCFIWVVENFYKRIQDNRDDNWSPKFYTSHIGYRLQAKICLDRALGMYIRLVKGDYDDWMAWPFCKLIAMTVLNQVDESESVTRILKPHPNDADEREVWIQPQSEKEDRIGWGFELFMPLTDITGENGTYASDFLRNDCIFIRIKLVDN